MKKLGALFLLLFAGQALAAPCDETDTTEGDTRIFQPCTIHPIPSIESVAGVPVDISGRYHVDGCGPGAQSVAWSGAFPTGVSVNSTTGFLSGTPTNPGEVSASLRCTNSVGFQELTFTWDVKSAVALTGYGSNSQFGAKGTAVCTVQNLNATGAGSYRQCYLDAVDGAGTTINFAVGGEIPLTNDFNINKSFITIDGMSAPAPGITITGRPTSIANGAHDVLLRGLRFRGEWDRDSDPPQTSTLAVDCFNDTGTPASHNVVLDRITVVDSMDSGPDIFGGCRDVTVQNSLMAYNYHPTSISGVGGSTQVRARTSLHHNIWYSNGERQPNVRGLLDSETSSSIYAGIGGYGIAIRYRDAIPTDRFNIINNAFLDYNAPLCDVQGSLDCHDISSGDGDDSPGEKAVVFWDDGPGKVPYSNCHYSGNSFPATEGASGSNDACTGSQFAWVGASTPPTRTAVADLPAYFFPQSGSSDFANVNVGAPYPTAEEQAIFLELYTEMTGAPSVTREIDVPGYTSGGTFNFGNVEQGDAASKTFIINNVSGGSDLTVGTATVGAPFSINLQPSSPVIGGASTSVRVTADSSGALGHYSQTLSIPTNDADENPWTQTIEMDIVAQVASDLDPRLPTIVDKCYDKIVTEGKTCANSDVRCVGAGQEHGTIASAVGVVNAGDAICLRGGTYAYAGPVVATRPGSAGNPIYMGEYPGEQAFLRGPGTEQCYYQTTNGFPCGDTAPSYILRLNADHWYVSNLDFSYAYYCVTIEGSNVSFVGNKVHDCWANSGNAGISMGGKRQSGAANDQYVALNHVYNIRHGAGIQLAGPIGPYNATINNFIAEFNVIQDTGYEPDGTKVAIITSGGGDPQGGGNGDSINNSRGCYNDAVPTTRRCFGLQVRHNISWHSADDVYDGVGDTGTQRSRWMSNIAYDGGPNAGQGFKNIGGGRPETVFIGNLAVGGPSGPGSGQDGFQIHILDQQSWFYNNGAYDNSRHGFIWGGNHTPFVSTTKLKNNASVGNGNTAFVNQGNADFTNNYSGGSPGLEGGSPTGFTLSESPPPGATIPELWQYYYDQFYGYFKPGAGSPLIDGGVFVSGIHCAQADDNGHPLNDRACLHWKGAAPDIGPFER